MDEDTYLENGEIAPANQRASRSKAVQTDRPIPGLVVSPEELTRQQLALVQYYTRRAHAGPLVDPMTLCGYAPMEIDGHPLAREPLAHARVAGADSEASDHDMYHPPPLDEMVVTILRGNRGSATATPGRSMTA
ncbi:hypothetical protein C8T65DRAFT_750006 [Cerioporus squamosus]|nr:hypothetical protein C8T65DRAFT_750006 [Cerioporus squamosus]